MGASTTKWLSQATPSTPASMGGTGRSWTRARIARSPSGRVRPRTPLRATRPRRRLHCSGQTFGVQDLRDNGFLFLIKSWTIGYRQSGWGSASGRDQNTYALLAKAYGAKQDQVHISHGDEIQLQNPSYWSWVLTAATGSYKSDTYWSPEAFYGKKYTCWKIVKA